jgi:hypothetical protein
MPIPRLCASSRTLASDNPFGVERSEIASGTPVRQYDQNSEGGRKQGNVDSLTEGDTMFL